jgi:hypothetical protein
MSPRGGEQEIHGSRFSRAVRRGRFSSRPGLVAQLVALATALIAARGAAMSAPQAVVVPMRDGAELAADLYLPEGDGPWPTILVQTPYDKSLYHDGGVPLPTEAYAWLIVDWRGHYGSSAWPDDPAKRGEDGYDSVEWIAAQSWSDGAVGGWGASALGFAQYRTAVEQPPHFVAAVPMFIDPVRDYAQFFPGAAQKYEYMLQQALLGYIDYAATLAHFTHDLYWTLSEAIGDATYDEIAIPMLVLGGWYDYDPGDLLDAFAQLRARSAVGVRDAHRLLVGPWTHAAQDELTQGELDYSGAVGAAAEAALAFLDLHLRGMGEGLVDRVSWFEMGRDRFRAADAWPPDGTAEQTFHLLPTNRLAAESPPAGDPTATLTGDPASPSPTRGGPRAFPGALSGPADLAALVESRADALLFTSDELTEALTIAGAPRLALTVDSDRLDTDVVARLTDVYPDGRSMLVTDGVRRARFRSGFAPADETLLVPGEPFALEIELEATALTLLPGHRLRLVLTTSSWPRFEVNENDGGPLYDLAATPFVVTNRVHLGAAAPSTLFLPVWPPDLFADGFEGGGTGAWSDAQP